MHPVATGRPKPPAMKTRRIRSKACCRCSATPGTLFRARVEAGGAWMFLCEPCLLAAKQAHAGYCYGGTWKARKRH